MEDYTHIQLDPATLPKDGQKIYFSLDEGEPDLLGEYIAPDEMFWINESDWHFAWKVIKWRPA